MQINVYIVFIKNNCVIFIRNCEILYILSWSTRDASIQRLLVQKYANIYFYISLCLSFIELSTAYNL